MIKKLEWGVWIITDCFTLFSFCSLVKHINLGLMRSNRSKQKELKFSYMCTFFRDDLTKKNNLRFNLGGGLDNLFPFYFAIFILSNSN